MNRPHDVPPFTHFVFEAEVPMQEYLSRKNIENFEKQLATTTDDVKKVMLKMLIEEEREKLRQLLQR